jgi:ferric-dicitrate binding protein FerR (iron transport regulator)
MNNRDDLNSDDAEIAAILRETGMRAEPPEGMVRDVQAAVHAEWQAVVKTRQRRRTFMWAAAASVCAVVLGATISLKVVEEQGRPVATIQRAEGEMFRASDSEHWSRIGEGQRIGIGDVVRSDARAALQFDNGLSVRIDRGTSFSIAARDRFALNAGAVYVDAKPGEPTEDFIVATHAGIIRHLGTQYQARMRVDGIEVSVREGRVIVEGEGTSSVATAGERLDISTRGSVRREPILPSDETWRWASEIAPPFSIENASLVAFLEWAARETGRPLVYESAQVQATATSVTLRGSVDGLAPEVALSAVLATTPLRRDETKDDVIEIGFASPIDSASTRRLTP